MDALTWIGGGAQGGKSTCGYLLKIRGAAFSWKSKLQSVVAASTLEAEVICYSQGVREEFWIKKIAQELNI